MTECSAEEVTELIAETRKIIDATGVRQSTMLMDRLANALGAVDTARESGMRMAREANRAAVKALNERDEAVAVIAEALEACDRVLAVKVAESSEGDAAAAGIAAGIKTILSRITDKEQNDDH